MYYNDLHRKDNLSMEIKLKELIENSGYDVKTISELSGVSATTIYKLLRDEDIKRQSTAIKIIQALNASNRIIKKDFVNGLDLNGKNIHLVDFENCASLSYLDKDDIAFVFFNQNNHSKKYLQESYGSKAILFPIVISKAYPNYVDNLIMFYLGRISASYEVASITIVSNDKCFSNCKDLLNDTFDDLNYDVKGINLAKDNIIDLYRKLYDFYNHTSNLIPSSQLMNFIKYQKIVISCKELSINEIQHRLIDSGILTYNQFTSAYEIKPNILEACIKTEKEYYK